MASSQQQSGKKQAAKKQAAAKGAKQPTDRQPKASSNGQASNDVLWRITYEHRVYEIGSRDLTDREARLFRREHGVSLRSCLEDPDLDMFVTLVWLMDRRDDETLSREAYEGTMTYLDFDGAG